MAAAAGERTAARPDYYAPDDRPWATSDAYYDWDRQRNAQRSAPPPSNLSKRKRGVVAKHHKKRKKKKNKGGRPSSMAKAAAGTHSMLEFFSPLVHVPWKSLASEVEEVTTVTRHPECSESCDEDYPFGEVVEEEFEEEEFEEEMAEPDQDGEADTPRGEYSNKFRKAGARAQADLLEAARLRHRGAPKRAATLVDGMEDGPAHSSDRAMNDSVNEAVRELRKITFRFGGIVMASAIFERYVNSPDIREIREYVRRAPQSSMHFLCEWCPPPAALQLLRTLRSALLVRARSLSHTRAPQPPPTHTHTHSQGVASAEGDRVELQDVLCLSQGRPNQRGPERDRCHDHRGPTARRTRAATSRPCPRTRRRPRRRSSSRRKTR